MSSGACRALVAVLLTLVATTMMALPVAAKTDRLNERSTVTYTVHPATGKIDVNVVIRLENQNQQPFTPKNWGPVVAEERVRPSVSNAFALGDSSELPGLWKAWNVKTPRIDGSGSSQNLVVKYTLDAGITQGDTRKARTPARVDEGYVYFCVPGQDTDSGAVRIKIDGNSKWKLSQNGTVLQPTNSGLKSETSRLPGEIFTCIEGTREGRLATTTFPGPAERQIVLQAWPDEPGWLQAAESTSVPALDAIHAFLGHDIPGESPVIVRQAPPRSLGGYASAHDTPGIVQLDESGGVIDPEHELAHVWFGTDNFIELWLREAMAEWTATAMDGNACVPVTGNAAGLDLSDWQVIQPTSDPNAIDQTIADQEDAACGIASAVASRMSDEQWRIAIGSLLNGETKYIGSAGPSAASTTRVDYREWLDAVDERGLVPAANTDATFAANLTDLDFAQNLLDEFGIPSDALELVRRSEARAEYHAFLAEAAPLGAPLAVREAMDNWEFGRAMGALAKSREVLATLNEADALLPDAGLIPFVQPAFENARNENALDDVLNETLTLLDSATEVFGPLGELQSATPEGWTLPAAIRNAITDQRFDDIISAITPAIEVVENVSAADAALPSAGLLEKYRTRYESTATADKLADLAADAASDGRNATRTGNALALLQREAGEWEIPAAVTSPIDQGQITAGLAIVNDARAVVGAARDADIALPEAGVSASIRPRFEAVLTGAEMAALRTEAEARRDEAELVGNALKSLATRVPTWTIPEVVTTPVEERDFATAALTAAAAQRWVEHAYQANQDLPELDALGRIKAEFESAQSLTQLEAGEALAESWAVAADRVSSAIKAADEPQGLLGRIGLWGVDVQPTIDLAMAAAIEGNVPEAFNKSAEVLDVMGSASSSGGLRLAGLVFFAVAVLGVLGLWVVLRRQAGPSWARQSTPHWMEQKGPAWRRRPKDPDKDNKS